MVDTVEQLDPGFELTHLERVLFPTSGLRKAGVIAYYVSVASQMLPHLRGRPLVWVRCPEGGRGKCFYQKHLGPGVPDAVERVRIQERHKSADYGVVNDETGLIALGQLDVLEVHTWCCHVARIERPDLLILDLDPHPDVGFADLAQAAHDVDNALSALGLRSFVKSTGGKGLHVVAPLEPELDWAEHLSLARSVAENLAARHPGRYLTNARKSMRKGKIYVDYLRNGRGASAVAPYSLRARAGAPAAVPLGWDELSASDHLPHFDARALITRLEAQRGDPWRGFFVLRQSVPKRVRRRLSE